MGKKSFLTATDGSTVVFDFDQSKSWQVTLGGNRSAVFAGGQEGDQVQVLIIQDDSGSRTCGFPSNVSFAASQAPTLRTAAGASDLFTFVKKGSTWKDIGGAPNRLPGRIVDAGLGTIIGAGVVALTLVSSGGGGQRPGPSLPDIASFCTGSGCTGNNVKVGKLTASGELVLGQSGSFALGTPTLNARGTDSKIFLNGKNGAITARSTVSGSQITVNPPAATNTGKLTIGGNAGTICMRDQAGVLYQLVITGAKLQTRIPVGSQCAQ